MSTDEKSKPIPEGDKTNVDDSPSSTNNHENRRLRRVTGGLSEEGPFESIYHNKKPIFLVKTNQGLKLKEVVTVDGKQVLPKTTCQLPYEPYNISKIGIVTLQKLFMMIFDIFNRFLDLEVSYKLLLTVCVLLSYIQEKLISVPYLFLFGDNECGKTVAATILNKLCYRPLYAVSIPPADVYGYLDDLSSPGTIIEDEAQGLDKDYDKVKIYKAGYKKGAKVPRFVRTDQNQFIKFYNVYCLKVFAAEKLPKVKGFIERLIMIPMFEGTPIKEWVDIDNNDFKQISNARNALLAWRLETFEKPLPDVEMPVKGRLKELWKPIIQVIHGLPQKQQMLDLLNRLQAERLRGKQDTLEGHIVKVVVEDYVKDKPMVFSFIWYKLANDLDGVTVKGNPHSMNTHDFGIVSKQKVGRRLGVILGGKSRVVRTKTCLVRLYDFDFAKIKRVAKKYGYPIVTELQISPTIVGTDANRIDAKRNEIPQHIEVDEEEWKTVSQSIDKISNTVTNKEELKKFLFELKQLTKDNNKIPSEAFHNLVVKYSIQTEDLIALSNSKIMTASTTEQSEGEHRFAIICWYMETKIDQFFESRGEGNEEESANATSSKTIGSENKEGGTQ